MRFAEKMLLRSMFHTLAIGRRHSVGGGRCALGLVEDGPLLKDMFGTPICVAKGYGVLYPWVTSIYPPVPCDCAGIPNGYLSMDSIIAHLFDFHVMGTKTRWSMEQLADFIEKHDPTPREAGEEAILAQKETDATPAEQAIAVSSRFGL